MVLQAKNNNKEVLNVWQPETGLVGIDPSKMILIEVIRHNDYLKITFEDFYKNQVDIIYDQIFGPMEYVVWSFRYGTEYGRPDLHAKEQDKSGLLNPYSPYFFKVLNSEYIKWFDRNPLVNSSTHPNLEHHLYVTGDDVFEVLSVYEPRIVKRTKV